MTIDMLAIKMRFNNNIKGQKIQDKGVIVHWRLMFSFKSAIWIPAQPHRLSI
jgi:hypothetical protein